jgi:hypothetical protein
VEDIDFLVDLVVAGNSNKLHLEERISSALNVFTLGPMAQATLVGIKKTFYFSHESVLSSIVCLLDTGMHQCWGGSLNF